MRQATKRRDQDAAEAPRFKIYLPRRLKITLRVEEYEGRKVFLLPKSEEVQADFRFDTLCLYAAEVIIDPDTRARIDRAADIRGETVQTTEFVVFRSGEEVDRGKLQHEIVSPGILMASGFEKLGTRRNGLPSESLEVGDLVEFLGQPRSFMQLTIQYWRKECTLPNVLRF